MMAQQKPTCPGLTNVVAIAAQYDHALALTDEGQVITWGSNGFGESKVPAGDIVAIAAGAYHSMALRSDGTVIAWGHNDYLQSDVPLRIHDVVAISAGWWHNFVLRADGTVDASGIMLSDRQKPSLD
jgi:alpha-tubulin suppressor-like RCC1 family protein